MNKTQLSKVLRVFIITTAMLFVFEGIFAIPQVIDFFKSYLLNASGIWVYIILWFIMFGQVTILNIPAYVILSASVSIGLDTLGWEYLLTVISAYMVGCILAYWLGRWFGVKAVRWCAGSQEEFDKWSYTMNKKGKWWYFITILFPLFPDDLLCIVAGSVKFHFGFYTIANLVGRSIGLVTMILVIRLVGMVGGNFPFMVIVWAVALVVELIALIIVNKKIKKEQKNVCQR